MTIVDEVTAAVVPPPPPVRPRRPRDRGVLLLVAPALALLVFACVLPMGFFLRYSVATFRDGQLLDDFSWSAYSTFMTSPYYHQVLIDTLIVTAWVIAISILIGYPLAYAMWVSRPLLRVVLGVIVFMPVLVSAVVRTYGWQIVLADNGPINWVLHAVGLTDEPVQLVFNQTGVVIALAHICLPFVVFPVYTSLQRVGPELLEAAGDLGAGWLFTQRRVILPLSLPGVIAGAEITATLALGSFLMPAMLGGGKVTILPVTIYNDTNNLNWPIAAVASLALVAISMLVVLGFERMTATRGGAA